MDARYRVHSHLGKYYYHQQTNVKLKFFYDYAIKTC